MSMKTCLKKQVSVLVCFFLLLGIVTPFPVYGEDDVPTATLSPAYLIKSDQPQTVTMYVRLPATTKCKIFSYTVMKDGNITVQSSSVADGSIEDAYGIVEPEDVVSGYTDIGKITYRIPANASGTFTLGIQDLQLSDGTNVYLMGGEVPVNLTVYNSAADAPAQGNSVSLSGTNTALVGEDVVYNIAVIGDSYASAQITLEYDEELLTFDKNKNANGISASEGVVTIVDYGTEKATPQQYSVTFTATKNGTAAATLTSAAFGTSDTAVSGDLKAATMTQDKAETVINKATLAVTLPENVEGETTVSYGSSYTFKPILEEAEKYHYTISAVMNGETVEVIDNGDGTYTVASVTDDLEITITKTIKKYTVTFQSNSVEATLPANGEVEHGAEYTFAMPAETGYILQVTKITIGDQVCECPDPVDDKVTIPGTAVTGNIVIQIERVGVTVTADGSGKADVTYAQTAAIGQDYSFTLKNAEGYDYDVVVTMSGTEVTPVVNGDRYTVKNVSGPIVITVEKSINTENTKISEYIKLDGSSVWLVEKQCNKLTDSVYLYNGSKMIWSEVYGAYCCLVISATEPEVTGETLTLASGTVETLNSGNDVNRTGKVDANDAQLVYDLYNKKYTDFSRVSMEKFLLADTNYDRAVTVTDTVAIVNEIVR